MSERTTLKSLDAPPEQESSELSSLRASKDLGNKPANLDAPGATAADLSQSSIPSSGINRVDSRPDRRIIKHGTDSAPVPGTERMSPASGKAPERTASGVFSNPFYPYQGNIIDRFVALIANICKVLERLLLKLLTGGDVTLPSPQPQKTIAKPGASADTSDGEKLEAAKKRQRELTTHRS